MAKCRQRVTNGRVALLEGLPSSSAVFCPKKLSRIKHQEGCQRDLANEPWIYQQDCGKHATMPTARPGPAERQEADGRGDQGQLRTRT